MFTKEQLEGIILSLGLPEISIEKDDRQSIGYRVRLIIKIRATNIEFLSMIKDTLKEYDVDSYLKEKENNSNRLLPYLRITSINNLLKFFELIPDLPSARYKFDDFLKVLTIVSNKHHLTQKGFNKILKIKGLIT